MEPADEQNDYLDEEYHHAYLTPDKYTEEFFKAEYAESEAQDEVFPDDFVARFGTKIIIYCERQQLLAEAMEKISTMIVSNLNTGPRMKIIFDVFEYFEGSEQTSRYVGITFNSIVHFRENSPDQEDFYHKFLSWLIFAHRNKVYETDTPVPQGYIAQTLGSVYLNILKNLPEKINYFAQFFSHIVKMELYDMDIAKEKAKKHSPIILNTYTFEEETPPEEKFLHSCILDYYNARMQNKDSEYSMPAGKREIQDLLEKLENVRSFSVQNIVSQKSIEHNKMVQKELKAKICTPEELIDANDVFFRCIELFRSEKRYNFKYIAVEDIRVLSQLTSIVLGFLVMILGILDQLPISIFQSLLFFLLMIFHGSFFFMRKFSKEFYPKDLSTKLEMEIGNFSFYFKKMSSEQMLNFFSEKIKDSEYQQFYPYIPMIISYVYDLISNKDQVICTGDDIASIAQKVEILVNRKAAGME